MSPTRSTPLRRSPVLLGWSSLLIASVSYTTADSDGNTETHSLKEQFVPPRTEHDAPYSADYREKLHWPPRKVGLHLIRGEKRTLDHEAEPVINVRNNLQKIEVRTVKGGGGKVDGGWLEKRGSLFPALRKAPLVVQVVALLQLCVSMAALGVSFIQGSKILFPSTGDSDAWHTEIDPYTFRHPTPPE